MEFVQNFFTGDTALYLNFVFNLIGFAAVSAAVLPRGSGRPVWFWKLVDLAAQNYRNAKNEQK